MLRTAELLSFGGPEIPLWNNEKHLVNIISIQINKDPWSFGSSSFQAPHLNCINSCSLPWRRYFLDKHNFSYHLSFSLLQVTPYHSPCKKVPHNVTFWHYSKRINLCILTVFMRENHSFMILEFKKWVKFYIILRHNKLIHMLRHSTIYS